MADNDRWRNTQDYSDREYDRSRGRFEGGSEDRYGGRGGRAGYRGGERDFGDRASDEVRSWLGDEDAERRRREDDRRGGGGYGRDYGSGSRSPSGDYTRGGGGYGRGRYSDYDRDYGRGSSEYGRSSYGGRGEYDSSGRRDYGGQDRSVTGYRGERGFWDRASDEVSSWFGDEEAARRREQDARQGDQGAQHHRGRGPKGYTRSDERIREDVSDRLTDDPYVDASEIEVSVSGGEVTLSGSVDSREARRRAEDIAERVSGVTHVQNNLRVQRQSPTAGSGAGGGATFGIGSSTSSSTSGVTGTGTSSVGTTSSLENTNPGVTTGSSRTP